MKVSAITEGILRCISTAERRKLGKAGVTAEEAQEKFVAKSERELQGQIAGLLRIRGIWFHSARMDRKTTGQVGTPDFLLALNGRPVALEAKHAKGKLSPEQIKTHEVMRRNGWRVEVVRSLGDVLGILGSCPE
jgi:hypothetical protein